VETPTKGTETPLQAKETSPGTKNDRPATNVDIIRLEAELNEIKQGLRSTAATSPARPCVHESTALTERLFRWMAVKGVSFRAIDSPLFREFLHEADPNFKMPCWKTLKERIHRMAGQVKDLPRLPQPTYCSLMLDGATKYNRRFLSAILFINGDVRFLNIFTPDNQKAKVMSNDISPMIRDLEARNYIVTAVCTDNASNEQALLNPVHEFSLQQQTGLPIIRIPCTAHTANLALHDVLEAKPDCILQQIRKIMAAIPTQVGSPFCQLPRLNEERWYSLGDVTSYIVTHRISIESYLEAKGQSEALMAFRTVGICELNDVMTAYRVFLKHVEANSTSYFEVFPHLSKFLLALERLSIVRNRHAAALSQSLLRRFSSTADMTLLLACYVLTKEGLAWYKSIRRDSNEGMALKKMVCNGLETLTSSFHHDPKIVKELFEMFVETATFGEASTREYWSGLDPQAEAGEKNVPIFPLVDIAKRVQAFAATETSCERLFCQLRNMVGDFRHRLATTTMRDLLWLRMDYLWNTAKDKQAHKIVKFLETEHSESRS
jgi:hypothetical protein